MFIWCCTTQVIFDEVARKREYYDGIMKRREKMVEVMETKDAEMDKVLEELKERQKSTFKNDLIE